MLAFVGQELGPYWAYLGPFWDMLGHFGPRWHHTWFMLSHFRGILGSVSAFVLDLGVSVSLNFCPCKAFAKNTTNTKEKIQYLGCVADGFCCYVLVVFVSFLGHAALRLCLPDLGLMLGHCGLCQHYIGLMLGHFGVFCRLCWPLLGKSWDDHIGLILGHVWACAWNVVFARYFSGVAVAFEWYFWWCMGGLLLMCVMVVVAWHVVSSHNMG